jgi:aspartokinase
VLKEITLPSNYTGTISQENEIITQINNSLVEIEEMIQGIPDEQMSFDSYITDFEKYEMDIYFSDNKNKATISIEEDIISVSIAGNVVRLDADGNII